VVGLVVDRVEHDHDGVAREPLDHAAFPLGDDRDRGTPVAVQYRDHLVGAAPAS
jgi:hypothetical protein